MEWPLGNPRTPGVGVLVLPAIALMIASYHPDRCTAERQRGQCSDRELGFLDSSSCDCQQSKRKQATLKIFQRFFQGRVGTSMPARPVAERRRITLAGALQYGHREGRAIRQQSHTEWVPRETGDIGRVTSEV